MSKRFWLVVLKQTAIALGVSFILGMIFNHVISDPDDRSPILSGVAGAVVYLAVSIVMAIIGGITSGLYLWLFGGKDFTRSALDDLRQAKIPAPRSYEPKTFDYLEFLANDEDALVPDRIRAAVLLGTYRAVMGVGIFRGLMIQQGFDDALLRYTQEAPQRE